MKLMAPFKSFLLLALCFKQSFEHDVAQPLITAVPIRAAVKRQFSGETCGWVNANVLQARGCTDGFTCYSDATLNVAGACCRLGDSNCAPPTACVSQAALAASCDSDCSDNGRIAKCSDSASPYCYTNYWVSGARTPVEIGCTTTQGFFAFVYTTYTGFGATLNAEATSGIASLIPTAQPTGSSGAGSSSGNANSGTGGNSESIPSSSSDSGDSSVPAGAIAGGVVGGIAVLGFIATVIMWIVLRHRRRSRSPAAAMAISGPVSAPAASSDGSVEKHAAAASVYDQQSQPPASPTGGTAAGTESHEMSSHERSYELFSQQQVQRPVRNRPPGRIVPELP